MPIAETNECNSLIVQLVLCFPDSFFVIMLVLYFVDSFFVIMFVYLLFLLLLWDFFPVYFF